MKLFSLYFVAAFLLPTFLFAKTIDKKISKSFDVEPGMRLLLKHGDGNVSITPWEKNELDIQVVYRATFSGFGRMEPDDFTVEFEQRRDQITVTGHEPNVIGFGNHRIKEYSYTIKAPVYLELEIKGIDGNVDIEDWQEKLTLSTIDGNISVNGVLADNVIAESVDGNLELLGIEAELRAETIDGRIMIENSAMPSCRAKSVDGSISISDSRGEFKLNTVDGNIDLNSVEAMSLDAQSDDGSFRADLLETKDMDASVRTGDGSVRMRLERGLSLKLDIRTGDGSIRADLSGLEDVEKDDEMLRGSLNGGQGQLVIRTGDGNVTLSER